ncbi:putative membrane protein [Ehrlichia japonica]|uniref:Putative membrane protein n=1 Tax=Ehrlichia japonica TaxID=391036 RepID=X5GK54_9RICK|nr:putative membrane protein [Ehrlichia japonica]
MFLSVFVICAGVCVACDYVFRSFLISTILMIKLHLVLL